MTRGARAARALAITLALSACQTAPEEPAHTRDRDTRRAPRPSPDQTPAECHRRAARLLSAGPSPSVWLRARPDLECACDGDIAEACTALGSSYGEDGAGPPDHTRAAEAWERACELGDGWGCTNFGTSLSRGRGVERDLTASHARYQRGCELGDGVACSNAAAQLANGRLGAPDIGGARDYLRRGCDLGDRQSCAGLSRLPP